MVADSKTNVFLDQASPTKQPYTPTKSHRGPHTPTKIPIPTKIPPAFQSPTKQQHIFLSPSFRRKSNAATRKGLSIDVLKDPFADTPTVTSPFQSPARPSPALSRNHSVFTLPDDDIHNASPHRPSVSRNDSLSSIASDIYSPPTPTQAPPALSLEHFSFLVKEWKEKAEKDTTPRPKFDRKMSYHQPKEVEVLREETSDEEEHVDPLTMIKPAEVETQLAKLQIDEKIDILNDVEDGPQPMVEWCTKEAIKPIYDPDEELKKISRQLLRCQKYALTSSLILVNVTLIFCSWYLSHLTTLTVGGGSNFIGSGSHY
jgi:hypothetical protein